MMRGLPGEFFVVVVLSYCPLQIWTLKTCNHALSKINITRSFKLDQLIEDDEEIT